MNAEALKEAIRQELPQASLVNCDPSLMECNNNLYTTEAQ